MIEDVLPEATYTGAHYLEILIDNNSSSFMHARLI